MKYWTEETQKSINNYFTSNTLEEKNKIFSNELYSDLNQLARQALFTYTKTINPDSLQELLIHINTNVLPKIEEARIKAVHQLIWVSLKRKIYSMYEENKLKNSFYTVTDNPEQIDYYSNTTSNEYDFIEDTIFIRKQIFIELDKKIEEQEIVNKKATIFLILLKEYILLNEFDCRGFRSYCCENMDITIERFSNLCSTLKIINSDFNKDLIDTRKQTINKSEKYMKK